MPSMTPGQPDPTDLTGDGFTDPNLGAPDDQGLPPDDGTGNPPSGDPGAGPRGYEYSWRGQRAQFTDDEIRPIYQKAGFSSPEDFITHLQKSREIAHWSQHYEQGSNALIEREQALAAQQEEIERQAMVLERARAAIFGGGGGFPGMPPGGYPNPYGGSSPPMGYPSPYMQPGRPGMAPGAPQGMPGMGFPPGAGRPPAPMDPYAFTGYAGQQIQALQGQVSQLMAQLAADREERALREEGMQIEGLADAFLTAKAGQDKELYGGITKQQLIQKARQLGYTRNRQMPWNDVFEETLWSMTRGKAERIYRERALREHRGPNRTAPVPPAGGQLPPRPGAPNLRPPLGGGPGQPQGLAGEIAAMETAMRGQEIPLGRQSSE